MTGSERRDHWTIQDLWDDLAPFEQELEAAGLKPASIRTYVGRTKFFLRWLTGDYRPTGPRS